MKTTNDDLSSQLKIYEFTFKRLIHDFNNILMSLMGYIYLLEEDLLEIDHVDSNIQKIKNSSKQTKLLIKKMLIFKDMLIKDKHTSKMSEEDMVDAWITFKNTN